ncbi:hypothetical protein SAMN05421837_101284 [Amycolatopsis pretoriensis]|uniref:Uncharacterized protein n=1 Tax=Amycolatopsis pretoriensis TaxID=218821 RepID=A0A1H5Q2U6_9PSEU|nr:hypothetical protein [Amycolatopsis pretoriensis]SEF20239.1 hypothetical protein SAMN05421837_101284 [Amycolatopsis pretoriensis]
MRFQVLDILTNPVTGHRVRAAAPTTLWTDQDPYGGRTAVHGRTTADAAGSIEGATL